ncbi:MBL fold metallo-hydrolase [Amycolatopsis sp. MtRt-6]|uniref:MBL fold metallo-hydrolase n=1 Tax=Amycolatopsis sp. MtRt-6 TaxID=2792782 RepID=UPI001A8F9BCF|nr:MBL fold metallo-hydrolase [Amycolatopsis sp. MtRt-6]
MPMELIVLGSASPYPRPGEPCSGYLVRGGGATVWLDAGPGTLAALQEHTALTDVDAIWISHLHADHVADLLPAVYALLFAELRPAKPMPLYGPPGIGERLGAFLSNTGPAPIGQAFAVHELHDGHFAEVDGLTLATRAVEHGFPAFGVRVTDGARVLAYSGDTGPCAALTELAGGADLFLCEADVPTPSPVHLTPEDAARAAHAAGKLVLTHIGPFLEPAEAAGRAGTDAVATPGTGYEV